MIAKISRYDMLAQILTAIVLMLLQNVVSPALAGERLQEGAPIRLPLTFAHSNAITTISVGGKTIQAGVDTGGGPITLSREVIDSVGGVRVPGTNVGTDSFGQSLIELRFRVPVVTIGGRDFQEHGCSRGTDLACQGRPPPFPTGLGDSSSANTSSFWTFRTGLSPCGRPARRARAARTAAVYRFRWCPRSSRASRLVTSAPHPVVHGCCSIAVLPIQRFQRHLRINYECRLKLAGRSDSGRSARSPRRAMTSALSSSS